MTPRLFVSLGVLAVASIGVAAMVHNLTSLWRDDEGADAAIFPALIEQANAVSEIRVTQGSRTLVVKREGEDWQLENHDLYPADPSKVRANIVGVAELRRFEPKTSDPALFDRLEVEDATRDGAKSRLVELLGDGGTSLARLIVGKTRRGVERASQDGVYVRREDEDRAWLAVGSADASLDLADWLDTRLTDLSVTDINRVEIQRGVAFPIRLQRAAGPDGGFALDSVPDRMKSKSGFALQNEIRRMSTVTFDDVRRAATGRPPSLVMKVEASNGLRLAFELRNEGDVGWVSLTASGEGAANERAAEINRRHEGWQMRLADKDLEAFTIMLADVIDTEGL